MRTEIRIPSLFLDHSVTIPQLIDLISHIISMGLQKNL